MFRPNRDSEQIRMDDLERIFQELSHDVFDSRSSKPDNGAEQESDDAPSPIQFEKQPDFLADRGLFVCVLFHGDLLTIM